MNIHFRALAMGVGLFMVGAGGAPAANLLVNGDFELGGFTPCSSGKGWTFTSSFPAGDFPRCQYDATVWVPVPPNMEGSHRGGTSVGTSASGASHVHQTVNVVAGQPIRLTGWVSGMSEGQATHFVRIHDGSSLAGPELASFVIPSEQAWHAFELNCTPADTQVVVDWGMDRPAPSSGAYKIMVTHADGFELTQGGCAAEPTIDWVSPGFAANDATLTGVQISGTGFDNTCQVTLRASGLPDIQATGEVANAEGTLLTFDLPLTGAAMGKRNVVVDKDQCNGTKLNNGFLVAVSALANGSFEDPAGTASCPTPARLGAPSNWLESGVSTEATHLMRDSDQYPPSCPRPDGDHYASIEVPIDVSIAVWNVYQYIALTPGQEITVSGEFAGGGRSEVELVIIDGDENGTVLASRLVENRIGCPLHVYDWVPASVTATPTQGVFTLMWKVGIQLNEFARTDIVHAAHLDNLVLTLGPPPAEICDNGLDDDGDRRTDCQDSDCAAVPACTPAPVEICGDGLDNDGDVLIDCDDSDCDAECVEVCGNLIDDDQDCEVDEGCTEICDNGVDDNQDGLVDCADPECFASPLCDEVCDNGVDDNNDGLVDCYDPVCATFPACQCHDPFADFNGDNHVDMVDFATWQQCYTTTADWVQVCVCVDHDRDGDVDGQDLVPFLNCARGAGVPADPGCD